MAILKGIYKFFSSFLFAAIILILLTNSLKEELNT